MSNQMYSAIGSVIPPKTIMVISKMYIVRQVEALIRALLSIQRQLKAREEPTSTTITPRELAQYWNQLDYYQTVYFNIELAASEISSSITESVHLKMDLSLRMICSLRAKIAELNDACDDDSNCEDSN